MLNLYWVRIYITYSVRKEMHGNPKQQEYPGFGYEDDLGCETPFLAMTIWGFFPLLQDIIVDHGGVYFWAPSHTYWLCAYK